MKNMRSHIRILIARRLWIKTWNHIENEMADHLRSHAWDKIDEQVWSRLNNIEIELWQHIRDKRSEQ
jgi:hypothetical protein